MRTSCLCSVMAVLLGRIVAHSSFMANRGFSYALLLWRSQIDIALYADRFNRLFVK